MNFCIAPTMPHPPPELICPNAVWQRLLIALRERGRHGRRESGAFLLGHPNEKPAHISDFVLYDDLDPHCLDRGIVHFDGRYYSALWERCQHAGLSVVTDVHTHPFGSHQSPSDRAHPMIATAGHIALILPRYAMDDVLRSEEIGMYRYLGARRWHSVPTGERAHFFEISGSQS